MSTLTKFTASAAVVLALVAGTTAASADDRTEWLRQLQQQREAQFAPATPLAVAAPGVARATVYTARPGVAAPVAAAPAPTVTRVAVAPTVSAAMQTAPVSARVPQLKSRTIGGRILVQPMTPAENKARATQMRQAGIAPGGGLPQMDPRYLPAVVDYRTSQKPGTIVIDTVEKYLYLVRADGTAMRYGVGVGRPGFEWAGTHKVSMKREWPGWTPPPAMRKREPHLPAYMEGGPNNPLGARAMYLGSSIYRIHGSNAPWTIGTAVSSGCIRMRNEDVIALYDEVKVGTKVVVVR